MNRHTLLSVMLFFIIQFSMNSTLIGAEPSFRFCRIETGNYTLNTPFENNLKHVVETLTSNISLAGFDNTSYGETPDKVYGLALCRGDVNSTVCQSCVENASQEIMKECRNKDAIIWYELCQVHYSFQNFFSMNVYAGRYPEWNSQEKFVSDPDCFYKVLMYLMSNLSSEAAFNPSKLMFATGEVKFSGRDTIYGLVQCTRDISRKDCKGCLDSALEDLNGCCYSRQGGVVFSWTCNVRFEVYSFYNASSYVLTYPTSKGVQSQFFADNC